MELYTEWSSPICEATNDFASFGVPQIYEPVESGAEEFAPVIGVADITHGLLMTFVRANALPVSRCVPDLAGSIVAR